jgi:hypothetical protein
MSSPPSSKPDSSESESTALFLFLPFPFVRSFVAVFVVWILFVDGPAFLLVGPCRYTIAPFAGLSGFSMRYFLIAISKMS